MSRFLGTLAVGCIAVVCLAAPAPKTGGTTYIDLQGKANQKLADDIGGRIPDNTLAAVPAGEQTLAGVKFKVGEKFVHLGGPLLPKEKPDKVEGIPVGRKAGKLHFLHPTLFGKAEPAIEDGAVVAEYRVNYDDGTAATVTARYGEDLRDWWYAKAAPDPGGKVKVAWEGENEAAKARASGIRLHLTTWKNPHPGKKVVTIDFARARDTPASPFCVAITAE